MAFPPGRASAMRPPAEPVSLKKTDRHKAMTRKNDSSIGEHAVPPVADAPIETTDGGRTANGDVVGDDELLQVIKDFLNMGHVDNIVAMFHRGACPFDWTGAILDDERLTVRLGVAVVFEELRRRRSDRLATAIPSLLPLLASEQAHLRGDAITVLGIIATPEALEYIRAQAGDPHPLVREIVADILAEQPDRGEKKRL